MANSSVVGTLRVLLTANSAEFEAAMKKAATSAEAWSKNLKQIGQQAKDVGMALTKTLTVPIVGVAAASVKAFASFDDAMVKSTAIMGDLSHEMREGLERAARDVAKTTTFSATQAAESFFFLASAGLDAKQSIEALPRVAAFAQAGNFDMARATDLLTDAQSALGLTIRDNVVANMENMTRVSDVLVRSNQMANASVQEFSLALTSGAGAALRATNKSLEEGAAALMLFADRGLKGAAAGDALNIFLRDIPRAVAKNSDEFKRLGIEVTDTSGNLLHVADIIDNLGDAFEKMSDTQKAAALDAMGLTRGVGNVIRTMAGGGDEIRRYHDGVRDVGNATQEVADKQLQSFSAQMGLLRSQIEDVAIEIGKALVPAITSARNAIKAAIPYVESAVKWFTSLPSGVQMAGVAFTGMVAAMGPVIWIFGQLVTSSAAIVTAFGKKGIAMKALQASYALTATSAKLMWAAILGPIGLVTAAITGLGVAWAKHKGDWTRFFDVVIPPLGMLRQAWDDLTEQIEEHKKVLSDLVTIVSGVFKIAWSIAISILKELRDTVLPPLVVAWDMLRKAVMGVVEWVAEKAGPAFEFFKSVAMGVIQPILDKWQQLKDFIDRFTSDSKKAVNELAEEFRALDPSPVTSGFEQLNERGLKPVTMSMEEMDRISDQLTDSVGLTANSLGGLTTASKESKEALKKLKATQDALFGRDTIASVLLTVQALGDVSNVSRLTAEAKDRLRSEVEKVLEVYKALGEQAPDALYRILEATRENIVATRNFTDTSVRAWVPFKAAVEDAGDSLHDLVSGTLQETGAAVLAAQQATEEWVTVHGDLKHAVKDSSEEIKDAIAVTVTWGSTMQGVIARIPQMVQSAFTGGGGFGGATKGIASMFGESALGKMFGPQGSLGKGLAKILPASFAAAIPGVGAALGSMIGPLIGKIGGLFTSKNTQEVKAYNIEIDKVRQTLLAQHGSLGQLEAAAQRVGLSFRDNWGHQGQEGLRQMNALVAEFQERQDDLQAAISKYGFSWEELGAQARGAHLAQIGEELTRHFTALVGAGADVNVVIDRMGDNIREFIQSALRTGTEIPAGMRPMLETMMEMGELVDENGDALTDMSRLTWSQTITQGFERVVERLDALLRGLGLISGELDGAANAAGGFVNALGNIPRNIGIDVEFNPGGMPEFDMGRAGFSSGTMGKLGKWFGNFGSGTPTILHGREAVVREDQTAAFVAAHADKAQTQQPITVHSEVDNHIYLDGQEVKRWMMDVFATSLEDNERGNRTRFRDAIGVT